MAAGVVARKVLDRHGITVVAHTLALGGIGAERLEMGEIERNSLFCPDPDAAAKMIKRLEQVKAAGDSVTS